MVIFHLFNAKTWTMILEVPIPDNEHTFSLLFMSFEKLSLI